jgi:hypothetical protein
MSPPRRSWNGMTYVLSLATDIEEVTWQLANGGTVTAELVPAASSSRSPRGLAWPAT